MGGRIGPADLATARPMFALWCLKKASRCDLRSPKCKKFSTLRTDNQQLAKWVSLIARLKHMKQTVEFLCKANGATLHYVLASFVLLILCQTSQKFSFVTGKAVS